MEDEGKAPVKVELEGNNKVEAKPKAYNLN